MRASLRGGFRRTRPRALPHVGRSGTPAGHLGTGRRRRYTALLALSASATALLSTLPSAGATGAQPVAALTPSLALTPAEMGRWETCGYPAPVRSIHAAVMRTGKVLMVAGSGYQKDAFAAGTFKSSVWTPPASCEGSSTAPAGTFVDVNVPWDAFCSGHAHLPDGKLLIAGGAAGYDPWRGSDRAYTFDPATQTYTATGRMTSGRWYPEVLSLGAAGRILAVSGRDAAGNRTATPETYNPATRTWTSRPDLKQALPEYPHMVLMKDGRLFHSGGGYKPSNRPGIWNLTSNAYTPVAGLRDAGLRRESATLLLPPAQRQRVMIAGGGSDTSTAATDIIDLSTTSPVPSYKPGPALPNAKTDVNAVILPDSTVLETGGSGRFRDVTTATSDTAVYTPGGTSWRPLASAPSARVYHSEAVLLPDGRVAVMGGNPKDNSFNLTIDLFSPPYLFKGERPSVTSGPTEIKYGGTHSFGVGTAAGSTLRSLVLVRPSAVTHATDPDQRLVNVNFTAASGGATATFQSNRNIAPPGWYMLFAVDSVGRPSVAKWVHLS